MVAQPHVLAQHALVGHAQLLHDLGRRRILRVTLAPNPMKAQTTEAEFEHRCGRFSGIALAPSLTQKPVPKLG